MLFETEIEIYESNAINTTPLKKQDVKNKHWKKKLLTIL